jgi:citrate synthase
MSTTTADTLSAGEAAALLGVKPATLYAYVSRGLLRSVPGPARRERRYLRPEVEQLRAERGRPGRRSGASGVAPALRWGEPVLESAITAIGPEGPRYRGRAAVALAEADAPFESVAEWLWGGAWVDAGPEWTGDGGQAVAPDVAPVPAGTPPIDALACLVPALGAREPERHQLGRSATIAAARRLILQCAAGVAAGLAPARAVAARGRSVAAVLGMALGARGGRAGVRALNRALVLCADHELNASTFAARVAASTDADLYACCAAALAALSGPRHGRHADRVAALVAEAGTAAAADRTVRARARRGEALPGFHHPLYPAGDPRAEPLLAAARALQPDDAGVAICDALVAAMAPAGGRPTLDVGLVALASALALPPGGATAVFAVGRMAGWVAHVLEQRDTGVMLRPRARYVGP